METLPDEDTGNCIYQGIKHKPYLQGSSSSILYFIYYSILIIDKYGGKKHNPSRQDVILQNVTSTYTHKLYNQKWNCYFL